MATLTIDKVRKSYGAAEILKGVSLEARDGDFLVLVGPSGCGKSTLLNLIAGLDGISGGHIAIDGEVMDDIHPKDRDIAMVFQSYALYPNMTVAQNIGFGLEMRGVPKPEREAAVARVARQLRLESMLGRKPSHLSGGQRQRVAMGRALVREPKIFLFDEPLSNLDAQLRVEMRTEIKKLHSHLGATIVYVTHDQIEAMTLATKIAVMLNGEVQQFGTPAELYDTPANTFVARFIGSPSMNLVKARASQKGEGTVLETAGTTLALARGVLPDGFDGRELLLGLRPEAFAEAERGEAPSQAVSQTVRLPVVAVEPTGPDTLAILRWNEAEVTARLPAKAQLREGEVTSFRVDMGSAVLFDPDTGNRIAPAVVGDVPAAAVAQGKRACA